MKKIYLLILLAVSMSFGLTVIGYPEDLNQISSNGGLFYPAFNISTQRSNGVNGFKVYLYFSNDKAGEQPALEVLDVAASNAAKKVERQRATSHVYRVMMDYSHKKVPSNDIFPSYAFPHFYAYINSANIQKHALRPYPWGKSYHNIVVESKDGEILYGKHPNYRSRVGLLSKDASVCKSGGYIYDKSPDPDVVIELNTEKNSKISGSKPNGVSISGRYVRFQYCVFEYDELPRVSYDYAVLKLDEECPVGSQPFKRHHDTKDKGSNKGYGPLWPNSIGSNADLEFCFVPKDPNSTLVYPFDFTYKNDYNTSVFANVYNKTNLVHSTVLVDDENSNNKNSWNFYGADKDIVARIKRIVNDNDHNTTYHVITRINPNLSKSAADIAESPISAEQPLVVAAPLAPAIKGLDRSAVAVELKSEGKVKVSIVNVNGSVIANIAQESLQPGVHQIKWNSGMVPSGRYIVKIEQNGMVNAKNVILK